MKKTIIKVLSLSLCSVLSLPISTYAVDENLYSTSTVFEVDSERTTGLILDNDLSISSISGCIIPEMETIGYDTMYEIGFKSVRVQRSSDQVTWSTEVNLNTIIITNASSYCYCDPISVEGGYYYRIILTHYAQDYSGNKQVISNTSNSVWVS